jgi:hypothetical protein
MGFQTTVNQLQGFGVIGDVYDDGPIRSEPFIINSPDAANNVMGRAFTVTSEQHARAGGTGVFAGFLINPKEQTTSGTSAGGTLAPTETIPNNTVAELLNMGSMVVSLPAAAAIGDLVLYDTTTGALSTIAPGATYPAGTLFAHAVVDRWTVSGAGLAVIKVTDVPVPPEPTP